MSNRKTSRNKGGGFKKFLYAVQEQIWYI